MFDLEKQQPESRDNALHVVFQGGRLISDMRSHRPCVLTDADLVANGWRIRREQFIGHWQTQPCFALEIDDLENIDPMRHQVGSLYELLGRVDDALFALAGRALQMLTWERDHRFCGRCGDPMTMLADERAMHCQRCDMSVYPRISPCIIVLVTRGEHLLLARHARYRRPMYSTLAGFIEAGENAEQCLQREVHEEVGITVGDIRYFHSQSWPFPGQLMLGYFASYEDGEICCDPKEIAEADWYHYSDLPPTPPETSIAGQLIRHYVSNLHA
ncbi:MAG: NAD(+) diphosphatase [Chromatocurvus sp.]